MLRRVVRVKFCKSDQGAQFGRKGQVGRRRACKEVASRYPRMELETTGGGADHNRAVGGKGKGRIQIDPAPMQVVFIRAQRSKDHR